MEAKFVNPPDSARPGVYWYFMDGNLNGKEMTADLEAMKAAGLGNLVFLEVDVGIPCFAVRDIGKVAVADGLESCLGKWTHLVASVNHDKLEFFVNGKKVASVPRGRNLVFFGDKSLVIGKEQAEQVLGGVAPAGSFTGLVSNLEYYRQYKVNL
jgi:hypothetical protein